MMKLLRSEWLKLKRTPTIWLVLLVPLVYSTFMIWYVSGRAATNGLNIFIFQAFFEVWAALVIPVGAGLLSGLMGQQEANAGNFHGLLSSKISRASLYTGKLLMLILLSALSTILATATLIIGLVYVAHIPISIPVFVAGAMIAIVTTIPLLALHLWIGLAWGMGSTIGIGGAGLLLGSLMATNLGDSYWQYIPWAWPVRLVMIPGFRLFPQKVEPRFFVQYFITGALPAGVFLSLVVIGGLLWFDKWEGRKISD